MNTQTKSPYPLYLLIVAVGVVIGLLLQRSSAIQDTSSSNSANNARNRPQTANQTVTANIAIEDIAANLRQTAQKLESLQQKVDAEISARDRLQQKLAVLEIQLAALQFQSVTTATEGDKTVTTIKTRPPMPVADTKTWFNENALLAIGVDVDKVRYLRDKYENIEMERLYTRDQAVREGWVGEARFQSAKQALNDKSSSFRNELTDPEYDAFLYATGQPNRVIVRSTLGNSPASKVGIQSGDVILQYDNKPVFSWNDLRQATTEGDPNGTVNVLLQRDGEKLNVFVPRGPLGVRLDNESLAP